MVSSQQKALTIYSHEPQETPVIGNVVDETAEDPGVWAPSSGILNTAGKYARFGRETKRQRQRQRQRRR